MQPSSAVVDDGDPIGRKAPWSKLERCRANPPSFPPADGLAVLAAAAAAHFLVSGPAAYSWEAVATALLAAFVGVSALAGLATHYPSSGLLKQLLLSLAVWAGVGCLLFLLAGAARPPGPALRHWAQIWVPLAVVGVGAARVLVWLGANWLARTGRLARSVAVLDLSGLAGECARRIQELGPEQVTLLGIWGGRQGLDKLIARADATRIDEVVVAFAGPDRRMLAEALRQLSDLPAGLHVWPAAPSLACSPRRRVGIGRIPTVTIRRAPPSGWRALAKRAQDIVLGSLLLVAVAPVLLLIAVAIRLDSPGPILFRQRRLGYDNKEFVIYKFRSMVHRPALDDDVPQATRADPRVSRVGAFLRRKSLDELPQILNVVRGDMSLVGPRPHAVAHHRLYAGLIEGYLARHRMRPGVTGWAQVNGLRGETDTIDKMRNRVLYDLAYIDDWSLWLDARILLKTAALIIVDRNAY